MHANALHPSRYITRCSVMRIQQVATTFAYDDDVASEVLRNTGIAVHTYSIGFQLREKPYALI